MIPLRMTLTRRVTAAAAATLVLGCGGSKGGGPGPTGPNPSIAISVSKTTLTAPQGGADNLTATITRAGGYTGIVNIETTGAPANVTAVASNVTTNGTVTSGTVTVSVGPTVPVGTYNLVVKATGVGVTEKTQAITLVVTALPTIGIQLASAAQSVDQGAAGAGVGITLNRTAFAGNVTFQVDGLPAGVTAGFNPQGTGTNASTMTLTVGAAVPAQTYNLTVRATGAGVTDATAPFALTVTVPQSYTLAVAPVSITQGTSAPTNVTITRSNFATPIALTLDAPPAGITGVFNPTPAPNNASVLTLTVAVTVAPGQYTLTVKGVAAPLADKTTTFVLTVTAPQGSYTLSTMPATSVPASQGSGSGVLIGINRTGGFTGPVTLSVTGAPAGMNITVPPGGLTGNSATIQVMIDPSLSADPYQVVIKGTSPGLPDKTVNLTILVSVPNTTLDYTACPSSTPLWVGYQDGTTGDWIQLLASGNQFKVRLTQTKVGFLTVLQGFGNNHTIWVRWSSAAELQAMDSHALCDDGVLGSNTVTVSETGLQGTDIGLVSLAGVNRVLNSLIPTGPLSNVPSGFHDLVARSTPQSGGFSANSRLIFRRGVNVNGNIVISALNFHPSTGEGVVPLAQTMTITGRQPGEILNNGGTTYTTGTACDNTSLFSTFINAQVDAFTAYGVPGVAQAAQDLNGVSITMQSSSGPTTGFRFVTETFGGAFIPKTIALGSAHPQPTITFVTAAHLRPRIQWNAPSDLQGGSTFFNSTHGFIMQASGAWLTGAAVDLLFPDLTVIPGIDLTWMLPPTHTTFPWFVSTSGAGGSPCAPGRTVSASLNGSTP